VKVLSCFFNAAEIKTNATIQYDHYKFKVQKEPRCDFGFWVLGFGLEIEPPRQPKRLPPLLSQGEELEFRFWLWIGRPLIKVVLSGWAARQLK
jgi:hypothetical protein